MDKELKRLSDEQKDFEFRRLFIEESEKTLHVIESRHIVTKFIAWAFLIVAAIYPTPLVSLYAIIVSVFLMVISMLFKKSYRKNSEGYQFGLIVVNSVIKQDYGISM